MLQNLRLEHIYNEGYASLRCCWSLGCPAEIQPGRIGGPDRTETFYTEAFKILFPNDVAPEVVGAPCCAQYAPFSRSFGPFFKIHASEVKLITAFANQVRSYEGTNPPAPITRLCPLSKMVA